MTHPPLDDTDTRTVLRTTPIDTDGNWWTGLVEDRDARTGERRLRLERWVDNDSGWLNPHTWRVRPDLWGDERGCVTTFQNQGGRAPPEELPIQDPYQAREYLCVRKGAQRWVAVVRVERPQKSDCTRLYHWDGKGETTRQKWTITWNWPEVQTTASARVEAGL